MSLKPLIITAIRIMTVSKAIENATLIVTTLSIMTLDNYAEWRSFNCMLIVVMPFVIILMVMAPNYRLFFIVRSNYFIFKYFEVMKEK